MSKLICLLIATAVFIGCSQSEPIPPPKTVDAEEKPGQQDQIGEFDADAGAEKVDSDVHITNPVTGPLEALGPMKQQISELAITQAVEIFRATEGRYPKDYDEFMSQVIKANQIHLPDLTQGLKYQYDVDNHCLVVVKEPK